MKLSTDWLLLVFCAIIILCLIVRCIIRSYYKWKTYTWIFEGPFMSKEEFERRWLGDKGLKNGLKHQDVSGCYVILIYSPNFDGVHFENYQNLYVGQSINIHQRFYDHLHGKGCAYLKSDIYLKNPIFVRFVPCARSEMNQFEKQIIWALDATLSYNQKRGGSLRR